MKLAAVLLLVCVGVAAARPGAPLTGRRLAQKDPNYVTGTNVLRTNRFSKLSNSAAQSLQANDAQAAAQAGDTTFLASSQNSYVAGRTGRDERNDLASQYTRSQISDGTAAGASAAATGQTALFSAASTSSLRSSAGLRATLASEGTQAAIQQSLDNPNDAFRATTEGAARAGGVSWPTSYNSWQ